MTSRNRLSCRLPRSLPFDHEDISACEISLTATFLLGRVFRMGGTGHRLGVGGDQAGEGPALALVEVMQQQLGDRRECRSSRE